jgi:hypothetical protein
MMSGTHILTEIRSDEVVVGDLVRGQWHVDRVTVALDGRINAIGTSPTTKAIFSFTRKPHEFVLVARLDNAVTLWDETLDVPAPAGATACHNCPNLGAIAGGARILCRRCANDGRRGKVWCPGCDGEGTVEGRDSLLRRLGERRCRTCGGSGMVDP